MLESCIRNIQSDTSRESNRSDKSPRWRRGRTTRRAAEAEAVTGEVPVLCKYQRKKWLSSVSAAMPINELWSLVYVELCSISATAWNVVTPPPLASHDLNRQWSLELSLYQIRASSSPWFRLRRTTIVRLRRFSWPTRISSNAFLVTVTDGFLTDHYDDLVIERE